MRSTLLMLLVAAMAQGCGGERILYQDDWPDITGPLKAEPHVQAVAPDYRAYTDSLMDVSFEEVAQ